MKTCADAAHSIIRKTHKIGYDIGYDIVCDIKYDMVYLGVLVPEVVTLNVKLIASCLGSAIEKFTLPLDTTKRVQVAMIFSNEISSDDCIQL